jgi:hypothetical protein
LLWQEQSWYFDVGSETVAITIRYRNGQANIEMIKVHRCPTLVPQTIIEDLHDKLGIFISVHIRHPKTLFCRSTPF